MSIQNPNYESPNIVIVPTVSFINNKNEEPPAKKQKVETSQSAETNNEKVIPNSKKSDTISQENLRECSSSKILQENLSECSSSNISQENLSDCASNNLSQENLNEESKKVDVNSIKKEIKVNSWASNYLTSIGMNTKPIKMNFSILKNRVEKLAIAGEKKQDDSVKPIIINSSEDNVCPLEDVNETNTTGCDASGSKPVENDVYPINNVSKTDLTVNTNTIGSSNTSEPKPLLYQFSQVAGQPLSIINPSENHLQNIEPPNLNTFNTTNPIKYDQYINPVPNYYNNNNHLNQTVFTPNYYEYTYNIIEQQLYQSSSGTGINYSHPTSQDIYAENDREYRDFYKNPQTNSKNNVSDHDFNDKPNPATKRRSRFDSDSSYSDAKINERHNTSDDIIAKTDRQYRDFYENPKTNRKNIDSDNILKDRNSKARRRNFFGSDSSSDATVDGRQKKYTKISSKRRRSDSRSPYKKVKDINKISKPIQKYNKERSHSPNYHRRNQSEGRSSTSESYKKRNSVQSKRNSVESKRVKYTPEKSKSTYDKEKKSEMERRYEEKKKSSKTKVPRSRTPEREQNKRPRRYSENLEKKAKPKKSTPIKSVVQPSDNFQEQHLKSPSPEPFDLRSILSRANQFHENDTPSKSTDTAMDRIRENLLVTINQPGKTEPKTKAPPKTKVAKKKSKGKKFKTIQLTIKVLCEDGSSSVSEESGEEVNSGDEPGVQRDLSFLDDFDIDEIVDSLKNIQRNAPKGNNSPSIIEKTETKKEVENLSVNLESSVKTEYIKVKEETNNTSQNCIILDESDANIKQEQIDECNNDCVILGTVPKPIKVVGTLIKKKTKTLLRKVEDIKTSKESNDCVIVDLIKSEKAKVKHENINESNDCIILEQSVENISIKTDSRDDDTSNDCIIVDPDNTTEIKTEVEKDDTKINMSDDCIIIESVEPIKIEPNNNEKERPAVSNVEVNECGNVHNNEETKSKETDNEHIEFVIAPTKIDDVSNIPLPSTPNPQESANETIQHKATSLNAQKVQTHLAAKEIKQELIDESTNVTQNTIEPTQKELLHIPPTNVSVQHETVLLKAKEIKQELINGNTHVIQDTNESTAPKELLYSTNGSVQQEILTPSSTKEVKQELIDENVTQDINESYVLKDNIPSMSTPALQELTNETVQQKLLTLLATNQIKQELIDKISPILQDTDKRDELLDIPLPENTLTINDISKQPGITVSKNPTSVRIGPISKKIKEELIDIDPFKAASNENQEETVNDKSYDSDASTVKLQYDSDDEKTDQLTEVEDIEMREAIDQEIKLLDKEEEIKEKQALLIQEKEDLTKETELKEKEDLTEETKPMEREEQITQQTKVMFEVTVPMEVDQICGKTNTLNSDTNAKLNSFTAETLDTQPNLPDTEIIIPENTIKTILEISKDIKQELIELELAIPKPNQSPKTEIAKSNQQAVPTTKIAKLKSKEAPKAAFEKNHVESSQKEAPKMIIDKLNKKESQKKEVVKPNPKETLSTDIASSSQQQMTNTEITKSSCQKVSPKEVFKPNTKETPKVEITKPILKEAPKSIQKNSPKKDIILNPKEAPYIIIPENTSKTILEISKDIKKELIEFKSAIPKPNQPPKTEIAISNQQGAPTTEIAKLKSKEVPKVAIEKNQVESSQKEEINKLNKEDSQKKEVVKTNPKETLSTDIASSSQQQVTNTEITKSNQEGAPTTENAKSSCQKISPKEVFKPNTKETPKVEITKPIPNEAPKAIQKVSPKKDIIFNPKEAPKSDIIKTSSKIKTEEPDRQVTVVKNNEIQISEFSETKKKLEDRMFEYLHDRHTIMSLIHSGRFSNIYRCHDSKKRNFAVKMIKDQSNRLSLGAEKEQIIQLLQRDIPKENIHTVFMIDSFGIDRHWALLMEYYPQDLKRVLSKRSKPFTIYQVQQLAGQLISALMVLRNNNIVHSDIKPAHILMNDACNKLKLCGFDSSNYEERLNVLPNTGTASYRAPEVIVGFSASFGIDVWSTAVVLYEMFTKKRLFGGLYNNTVLFNQMCLFGDMPPDMIYRSVFKANHFNGVHFLKRSGPNGSHTQIINKFHHTPKFYRFLYSSYEHFWGSRTVVERANDMVKLYGFFKLLEQMLVIDPRQRLAIEYVCTDPFITDMMT